MWSRIHLIPLLQAEEDRDQVRRYYADKAREKALMGSETKVYNSGRYVSFDRRMFQHVQLNSCVLLSGSPKQKSPESGPGALVR